MYFISKIYQSTKTLTAVSGTIGSLMAICAGSISSGGTIYIIGGSLCLANSLFNLIEVGKVNLDIKKQIDILNIAVNNLSESSQTFIIENKKLQEIIKQAYNQITLLENVRIQLESSNDNLKEKIEYFTIENEKLSDSLKDLNNQIKVIEELKNNFSEENAQFKKQIIEQNNIIIQSKLLIQQLAKFGDEYTNFSNTINNTVTNLENTNDSLGTTLNILEKLVNDLKKRTFQELDNNADGLVTNDEYNDYLLNNY